jgi:predicted dehydrogenase
MHKLPLRVAVVGAGHRAIGYAKYALEHPERMTVTAMADPDPLRRRKTAETFALPENRCFETAAQLAEHPELADAVINGTMDHQHVPTSLPLLEAGFDLLLEKPFAISTDEALTLVRAARRLERRVMICHVLRYAPFYQQVCGLVREGRIGEILNVQLLEHVSYHHMATCYVRGKWNDTRKTQASMLLAKCCHDLDLLAWMKSPARPRKVASFGTNQYFRPEKAPAGSGTRCLVDCPIEADCPYSARKLYLDHPKRWAFYVWACLEHIDEPTIEEMTASLKGDNPHGRCVWKCEEMDVVDHQSVAVQFDDGATATHNMVGGTARPMRAVHLLGSEGEIQGTFEDRRFVVRHIDNRPGHEFREEWTDLNVSGDMQGAFGGHGGGDSRMVADFVDTLSGAEPSLSCTSLEDSLNSHLMVFCADASREAGGTAVELPTVD